GGGRSRRGEAEAMEAAGEAAGAAWDSWREAARALVGAIVEREEPGEPPLEYKSAELAHPARAGAFLPLDRVAGVRPAEPRGAAPRARSSAGKPRRRQLRPAVTRPGELP